MPTLILDITKSIEENASRYFDKAKDMKRKIKGAEEALRQSKIKLQELETKKEQQETKKIQEKQYAAREKQWYEKFRWFRSSDNFLVIGGRDATTNEIVVKKHSQPGDIVFHTDIAGSPFIVIQSEKKEIPEATMREAADATCTFSRVWKLGLQSTDVFYVAPEQVTKKTKAGEFMGKGAFMIFGKTNYIDNRINLAVGKTKDNSIMAGPLSAVSKHCEKYVVLYQGDEKASSIAKKIQHFLGKDVPVDEIIRSLPAGEFKIKK